MLDVAVDGRGLRVSSVDRDGLSILAGSDSAPPVRIARAPGIRDLKVESGGRALAAARR